jgi:APA family basic amino acid/polyamine antiporter
MASLLQQALRRKPVTELTAETGTDTGGGELERSIGLFQLSTIGIGATIGTGIFFVLSQAVPIAGPAVVWSFVVAGVVAGLTAVCYAELTSAVPVSGSSYSYAYATLGEIVAMGVAACLLLEYGVSAAAVAVGWSEYLNQLLGNVFGVQIPEALSNSPESGGILNLSAVVLVALCALLLIRGTSESAKVNATMVVIKLADVEWTAGDVLVVGSSTAGPLERVFLGSRASKIVRNAPVPVVALPRRAVVQLADEAERV